MVDLETTGLTDESDARPIEFGAVLLDPGRARVTTAHSLVRPGVPLPRSIQRLTGLSDEALAGAPTIDALAPRIAALLGQRALVAHHADFERHFLGRFVSPALGRSDWLDSLEPLALGHPDASDLRLETLVRLLLGEEEQHRALRDALDTTRVLARVAARARAGEQRYRNARRALERFAPDSPWLALFGKEAFAASADAPPQYLEIGPSAEPPVPFDEQAIVAALADEARGRRHFPGYRVREAQLEMTRSFVRHLADGGVLLLEGGTGIGKSLAYLAAAIPFAMDRARAGERTPLVISTRTKLLQDQLLAKDIGAAARMLGHPELRALSIKGRANYACARRLEAVLAEGGETRLLPEDRLAYAVLFACARTRAYGELGAVPGVLLHRFPLLRELLRRSVAARPEHCTREQCASQPTCPFGRRRAALAQAQLVVANHDLLLRWPPDYPRCEHAIADEAHELADVADEVYALEVGPQSVLECLDGIFGRPSERGRGEAWLPARSRRAAGRDAVAWRREIQQELVALGRSLAEQAEQAELDVPAEPPQRLAAAGELARTAAQRLDLACDELERLAPAGAAETGSPFGRALQELRDGAAVLRLPFEGAGLDQVATFEGLEPPFDRWRLVVRRVDPSTAFHRGVLEPLTSFAGVSASLFVNGDAFAALGELDLEGWAGDRLERASLASPFPYAEHMRVLVLERPGDLVEETTEVLSELARRLGGRTLGLFTSLRRMHDVAGRLATRLRGEGIDVLAPRRASDDPAALVARFVRGASVLLGARRFWQGLDVPGPDLQAVVIEKLPFEVPTELRRRREQRLRARGEDAFGRYRLGKMLLYLKQMCGRLIRGEEDRGVVVIVEGRAQMGYFRRLSESLPPGVTLRVAGRDALDELLDEVGIGSDAGSPV